MFCFLLPLGTLILFSEIPTLTHARPVQETWLCLALLGLEAGMTRWHLVLALYNAGIPQIQNFSCFTSTVAE